MAVFRVEKTKDFTIMSNHHLRNTELSLKAKGLLSLMLSLPEDWDYTTKGLAHICKDGVDSITTALKELERHGYLTRQRLRYDNGQLGDIEYTIHEQPVSTENTGLSPKRENPRQVKPEQAKPKQAEPEQENPAQLNTNPLKTKKSKKDKSITYPSIYPAEPEAANRTDGMDRIELIEAYREIIKENIEFEALVHRYGYERVDELVELMLQTVLSQRPYIRIAGDDLTADIQEYMSRQHNVKVSERMAERIKINVGAALTELGEDAPEDYIVHGPNRITALPMEVPVCYQEVAHCLEKSISKIETAILSALENTPPELYADIVHNGIYLAGGGALLRGLDKRLTDKINIPFHIAEDPLHAVAKGTGIALKNVDRFSFLMR